VTSESIEAYESIAHPVPGRVSRMVRSEQA
jgi:hypothetical protein